MYHNRMVHFIRSKESHMRCLDPHGHDESTPDCSEMLVGSLDTVPQALDDCNMNRRKPPVFRFLPPPPPIPCLMLDTYEVQGAHGLKSQMCGVLEDCNAERHA